MYAGAAFVSDHAGERRLDVLGDVAGIDRPHPLAVACRKRDVLERTERDRGARQERRAGGGSALVGLAMRAEVLLIETALVDGRVRRGRVRDVFDRARLLTSYVKRSPRNPPRSESQESG